MKKGKKIKNSDLKEAKNSKKESKKKSANEEKKIEVASKKPKPPVTSEIPSFEDVDYASLKKTMIDCARLYQNILVLPRSYDAPDGKHSLYPSELKALDMIGVFSGINLTQLANKLDISKSAVSKCSAKLLEKELITKEKSETNIREVIFMLSETGQSIYDQLEDAHTDLFKPINTCIEGLSPQEITEFDRLFSKINSGLTEIYEKIQA